MNWHVVAALILSFTCFSCTSGQPANEGQDAPVELPFRCLEYTSAWKGKGTPRELEILEEMDNNQLREFLKDFEAEP